MPVSAEQLAIHSPELSFEGRLIDADLFFGFDRHLFQTEAEQRLSESREQLINGEFESVPMAVDALGTARIMADLSKTHGPYSPEYQEARLGLMQDTARLIAETERKLRWEYFPRSYQARSEADSHYYSNGISLHSIVKNGLSPIAEAEEQIIRVHEYVGERTNELVGSTNLADENIVLIGIKPCPDYVIDNFKLDSKKPHGGYVPDIEKLVIESFQFDAGGRYHEQLAVPGTYITQEVINDVLSDAGAKASEPLSKLEVRSKQFISTADSPLIDIMARLDTRASLLSDLNIFMGEEVSADHPKDYEAAFNEAMDRQASQQARVEATVEVIMSYQAQGLDPQLAGFLLNQYLKKTLFELVVDNPDKAAEIFDQETADAIRALQNDGSSDKDNSIFKSMIYARAPMPSFCGAGSCGLEFAQGAQSTEARKLGLSGEIIYDTVRGCPSCQAKAVYYDINGSKACTNCSKVELRKG